MLDCKPDVGDYISLDGDGINPYDFNIGGEAINWHCSKVTERNGDFYKVAYDDGARQYEFKQFYKRRPSKTGSFVYLAKPC